MMKYHYYIIFKGGRHFDFFSNDENFVCNFNQARKKKSKYWISRSNANIFKISEIAGIMRFPKEN